MTFENRFVQAGQVAWSQFSIKIVGVHFCNYAHQEVGQNKRKSNKQNSYLKYNTPYNRALLENKKITVNQII